LFFYYITKNLKNQEVSTNLFRKSSIFHQIFSKFYHIFFTLHPQTAAAYASLPSCKFYNLQIVYNYHRSAHRFPLKKTPCSPTASGDPLSPISPAFPSENGDPLSPKHPSVKQTRQKNPRPSPTKLFHRLPPLRQNPNRATHLQKTPSNVNQQLHLVETASQKCQPRVAPQATNLQNNPKKRFSVITTDRTDNLNKPREAFHPPSS